MRGQDKKKSAQEGAQSKTERAKFDTDPAAVARVVPWSSAPEYMELEAAAEYLRAAVGAWQGGERELCIVSRDCWVLTDQSGGADVLDLPEAVVLAAIVRELDRLRRARAAFHNRQAFDLLAGGGQA